MDNALKPLTLNQPSKVSVLPAARWIPLFAVAASLTLFASPRASAQDTGSSDQQQAQSPDDQAPPPQQDQRRVISRDTIPQNNPDAQGAPDQGPDQNPNSGDQGQRNRRPYPRRHATGDLPGELTIPAGKVIFIRLNDRLSSDHNQPGDGFTATLDQPIVVSGWVVARRGDTVVGSVTAAQKAGRVKGVSHLGLELTDLTVVDGQQLPIETELWKGSAGTSHGNDAGAIATTTGVGTIIGAAADGGEGAGIGAGAGAAAGIAAVLLTRGKPTVLGPEARLSFRIKEPITVSTENSRMAFQPAGSGDYNTGSPRPRPSGYAGGYPVAYPPYYAGCGPYWGCGPYYNPYYGFYGPSVGFYWGGGFGHHGWGHGFHR